MSAKGCIPDCAPECTGVEPVALDHKAYSAALIEAAQEWADYIYREADRSEYKDNIDDWRCMGMNAFYAGDEWARKRFAHPPTSEWNEALEAAIEVLDEEGLSGKAHVLERLKELMQEPR